MLRKLIQAWQTFCYNRDARAREAAREDAFFQNHRVAPQGMIDDPGVKRLPAPPVTARSAHGAAHA